MSDLPLGFWMAAAGVLANVTCGVLGCFLVLRRMSLLGDAISHAVLPGIVLAFLFSGQISGWPMVIGAVALGLLTSFLTETLHWHGRSPEDASMGVVFTTLFALGVILITRFASRVDIDPGCVYYGAIEFVPWYRVDFLGFEIPRAVATLSVALVATVLFVAIFWKELKIASFDPALAAALGFSPVLIHYLLMAMVSAVTVASFEAVGSILVVAMLIVPGATAQLLTDRLRTMVLLAAAVGVISGVAGYWLADRWNTTAAGMMAVIAGCQFGLAVFFAPRHGLLSRSLARLRLALRVMSEDILVTLYRREESSAAMDSATAPAEIRPTESSLLRRWALGRLLRDDSVARSDAGVRLTGKGREAGRRLLRAHRLWEAYLRENFDLPLDHLHEPAERMEHYINPELQAALAEELQTPSVDPHGRDIPEVDEIDNAKDGQD